MKSWNIDPRTGDYVMNPNGTPQETDSLKVPAYFRLKVPRGTWMYAPDSDYGSDFGTVKKRHSAQDGSNIEAIGVRALKPLIDDGRASTVTVEARVQSRYGVGLEIDLVDASGGADQLKLDSIG